MNGIRVIAADLDGTLLGSGGVLTDRTRAALEAARERGIAVLAVTARPPRVFEEWTALAGVLDAAICANGAITYDLAERAVADSRPLDREAAAAAAKLLAAAIPRLRFAVETGWAVVAEPEYAHVDSVGERRVSAAGLAEVFASAGPFVKLLAHAEGARSDALLAAARGVDLPGVELVHSGGRGLLELSAAGVSKADALERWCCGRGIGPGAVAAFGDAPNDVPMLEWARHSFAVANAHPEAAAAARHRCGANTEDGVAAAVEALLTEAG